MERIVKITPAFDKRHPEPSKNYGIGCCKMFMVLKGDLGAVVFTVNTAWYLPETDEWKAHWVRIHGHGPWSAKGNAVCYCSPRPLREDQEGRENCDWPGCTCYGDCGYTISDEPFGLLITDGSDAVWK